MVHLKRHFYRADVCFYTLFSAIIHFLLYTRDFPYTGEAVKSWCCIFSMTLIPCTGALISDSPPASLIVLMADCHLLVKNMLVCLIKTEQCQEDSQLIWLLWLRLPRSHLVPSLSFSQRSGWPLQRPQAFHLKSSEGISKDSKDRLINILKTPEIDHG